MTLGKPQQYQILPDEWSRFQAWLFDSSDLCDLSHFYVPSLVSSIDKIEKRVVVGGNSDLIEVLRGLSRMILAKWD